MDSIRSLFLGGKGEDCDFEIKVNLSEPSLPRQRFREKEFNLTDALLSVFDCQTQLAVPIRDLFI